MYNRHLRFESVSNFRDIGGYRTRKGDTVAWRRIFRSGEFKDLNKQELQKLTKDIGLISVIDLRGAMELERQGIGLLSEANIKYHSVPFSTGVANRADDERLFRKCTNMGEFYLDIVRHPDYGGQILEALEIIAMPGNHPLVFHCAVGKDRTGILAAMLLSILGVEDTDIIEDYSLSDPYMVELQKRINSDPKAAAAAQPLPDYFWKATPESMALFLSTLRKEYGSINGYLEAMGMEPSLPKRLAAVLLV